MVLNYIYFCYILILENRILFYIFIYLAYTLYSYNNVEYLCYDGPGESSQYNGRPVYRAYDPNYVQTSQGWRAEIDGRSIHELSSVPLEPRYQAYNPNYISTSQGYRVELENTQANLNYTTSPRIPNPSHYPLNSPLLGTIHSDDRSYTVGIIEPTRSEIEINGYHTGGNNEGKNYPKYEEHKGLSTVIKDRCKNIGKSINKHYDNNYDRAQRDLSKMKTTHSHKIETNQKIREMTFGENYVKGQGHYSRAELKALHKQGLYIKNGKLKKM